MEPMHNHTHHDMIMMPMYFDASINVGALLFKEWQVNTGWMYALAIMVMVLASILNQFLFFIVRKNIDNKPTLEGYQQVEKNRNMRIYMWYAIKSVVFLFQNALSYLLMLAVMTFNVGIFVAVIVGNTIGWMIFSMRYVDYKDVAKLTQQRYNIAPDGCH
ncbi:COPT6 [Acrasis kona]|uniref:Copper transport protein n=1 Tax=Acrasis kona TaxID=1008807 RepID=A0AAW2Z8K9_9EUKA